jgi:2',3'-cyclic-nucleotide 2'-phosphodiesterase (5'-nucleotidase family)
MTIRFLKIAIVLFFFSCNTSYHPGSLRYTDYPVEAKSVSDTTFGKYLKPFRDSMDIVMNEIVGDIPQRMDVKRPVTTLGNFLCDAFVYMAKDKFDPRAEISYLGLGSIRRPYLEAGPVTRGAIFEVMPFDNIMVLITVKGSLLKKFIEDMEEGGGIAGFTMTIRDKKVMNIMVGGKEIVEEAEYTIVSSDYYANNPAMSWFYGQAKRKDTNYLIRDAIIDYVKIMKQKGMPLGTQLENRITLGN